MYLKSNTTSNHIFPILEDIERKCLSHTLTSHITDTLVTAVELTPVQRALSDTTLDFTCHVLSVL